MARSCRLAVAAAALVLAALGGGGAGAADTGTVVVRLTTDPAPAGATWTYTGLPSSFALGDTTPERTLAVPAGTYTLGERATSVDQPPTLTGLTCSDPSRDTRVQVRAATADLSLAAGETVTCTFVHRALGPRPTATALALAQRFAPVLRLAASERYRPLAIEDYLSTTTLLAGTPPRGRVAQTAPTLFTLPTAPAPTYLDVRGAQPTARTPAYPSIEQRLERASPRPTVYWHLARQPSTGRIALEYWFLYLYNDFYDAHEADWEGVTVFLHDGTPLGATYSQHQGRVWVPWSAAPIDRGPTLYVGRGSHANYPLPGTHRVRVCWSIGVRRCTTAPRLDAARGDGVTLAPAAYDLHELGGMGYTGGFGSGTYLLGLRQTKDRVVDPRRRSDYSNPFAAIPTG